MEIQWKYNRNTIVFRTANINEYREANIHLYREAYFNEYSEACPPKADAVQNTTFSDECLVILYRRPRLRRMVIHLHKAKIFNTENQIRSVFFFYILQ